MYVMPSIAQLLAEGWTLRNDSVKRSAKAREKELPANDCTFVLIGVTDNTNTESITEVVTEAIERGIVIGKLGHWVRRVGNLRGSEGTPLRTATEIRDLIKKIPGVSFPFGELLDTGFYECDNTGKPWGGFLSVANGAKHPPYGVFARYDCGKPGAKTIALLGKGVTFDTGGFKRKPGNHMDEMYLDDVGAIIKAATFAYLVAMNPECNIVFMANMTENRDGTLPSDFFTTRGGRIIENVHTDAEGRIVLDDGIDFLTEYGVDHIIDAATLTGAAVVALGGRVAAFSSAGSVSDELSGLSDLLPLIRGTQEAGFGFWPMPMPRNQAELMASQEGDGINSDLKGVYGCGTAALFLLQALEGANKNYGKRTTLWHLDIAGMMKIDKASSYRLFGADPAAFIALVWAILPMMEENNRFGICPPPVNGC